MFDLCNSLPELEHAPLAERLCNCERLLETKDFYIAVNVMLGPKVMSVAVPLLGGRRGCPKRRFAD